MMSRANLITKPTTEMNLKYEVVIGFSRQSTMSAADLRVVRQLQRRGVASLGEATQLRLKMIVVRELICAIERWSKQIEQR